MIPSDVVIMISMHLMNQLRNVHGM